MPKFSTIPPAKLEAEVIAWTELAVRQAEEETSQSPALKLFPKIIQYLCGNQWPNRPTAYGSARPVTNHMFRQYWELVSLLTEGKPEPQIKVWDRHNDFSTIQAKLTQFLQFWATDPGYPEALQDIVGMGLLARGFGKVQWNPKLKGGYGDTEIISINPMKLSILGGDGSLEKSECVIEKDLVSIASLIRRYGDLARDVEPEAPGITALAQPMRPSSLSSAEWSKLSPQMRRVLGVKSGGANGSEQLYPMAMMRQFWMLDPSLNETGETIQMGPAKANWGYKVAPGQPLYPRGRLVVTAGKKVLDDTCNPYFYNQHHPYVDFKPLKGPWAAEGMSVMGNQIGPQDVLNRIMSGLLETIKAGLTPTIIAPRNSVSRGDLDNISTTISGGKLEFNQNSGSAPTFRPQPEIPSLAMPFAQMIQDEMDKSTGSSAINDAAAKDQIPSHDSLELINNSRSALVRVMGRALERFMTKAGQLVMSNMLQFYTVGHRVAILGEDGIMPSDFQPLYGSMLNTHSGTRPEEVVRKFQFSIRPGSALTFDKETRVQMAAVLRRTGDLSRKNLFRVLDANVDMDQNERELKEEALDKLKLAMLANAAAAQAKQGPQGPH